LDITAPGVRCILRNYNAVSPLAGGKCCVEYGSISQYAADDDCLYSVTSQEGAESCIGELVWRYIIGDDCVAGLVCDL
jgi:hypothetical protein